MESEGSSGEVNERSFNQNAPLDPPAHEPNSSSTLVASGDLEELELELMGAGSAMAGGTEVLDHDTDTPAPAPVMDAQSTVLGNDDLLRLIFSFQAIPTTAVPFQCARDKYTLIPARLRSSIAETSSSDTQNTRKLGDLVKAALTCKTFFLPAMSALWQSMDSVVPLVKLIRGVVKEDNSDVLTTKGVISEEDLVRFDLYARFVRRLELSANQLQDRTKDGCIAGHIFATVHDYRPQGFLPTLTVLELTQAELLRGEDFWFLKSTVSSADTLSQLVIEGISKGGSALIASFLNSVHMKSPRLAAIALDGWQDCEILRVVNNISRLQSVSLKIDPSPGLRSDFTIVTQFQCQRSMSNVVNLHLTGTSKSTYQVFRGVFHQTPQLKNLKVSLLVSLFNDRQNSSYIDHLAANIVDRETTFLESFIIDFESWPPKGVLASKSMHTSLSRFQSHCFRKLQNLSIPLPMGEFPPLSPHRSLISLEISSGIREGADAFEMSLLAVKNILNWAPNLKYLYIPILLNTGDNGFLEYENGANSCHGLQEFGLKPFRQSGPRSFIYPQWHFPSQKIADLLVIARSLDRLFPHLKTIDTKGLRGFIEERWLDGLEAAVKHFGEQRRSLKWRCETCGEC